MKSLKINYHNISSELCEIEKKYNVGNYRLRHPYTLFYNGLFTNKKNGNLKIAELEVSDRNSLLLWSEYFKNAEIYGIDYNKLIRTAFQNRLVNQILCLIL